MTDETETPASTDLEVSLNQTGLAKPPYSLAHRIPSNVHVCAVCRLPFGRISFNDIKGERFNVTVNTNCRKRKDGKVVHANLKICELGVEFADF